MLILWERIGRGSRGVMGTGLAWLVFSRFGVHKWMVQRESGCRQGGLWEQCSGDFGGGRSMGAPAQLAAARSASCPLDRQTHTRGGVWF